MNLSPMQPCWLLAQSEQCRPGRAGDTHHPREVVEKGGQTSLALPGQGRCNDVLKHGGLAVRLGVDTVWPHLFNVHHPQFGPWTAKSVASLKASFGACKKEKAAILTGIVQPCESSLASHERLC